MLTHCPRDLVEFPRQCHIGHCVTEARSFSPARVKPREMAARELTLNRSGYQRTVAIRNPEYRPMHGYLAPKGRLRVFKLAGFSEARVYPDLDALSFDPSHSVCGVIVADK